MTNVKVQSICPICNKPIAAAYTARDDKIYFEKTCAEHGDFRELVSNRASDFEDWVSHPVVNIPPKVAMTKGAERSTRNHPHTGADASTHPDRASGANEYVDPDADECPDECPLHCGVCTNHMQTACCVLIDITDRCNQRCPYCFAKSELDADSASEPTLAELDAKFALLLELGEERPFNLQISGGEPTVRDDLPEIIERARNKGFTYVQINTNGRRLAEEAGYAEILKRAGASVIFLQFDGTTDEIYMKLRAEPLLSLKRKAIARCRAAGLPVTLVPTVVNGVNLNNIGEMIDFLLDNIDIVKGVHFQPVSFFGRHDDAEHRGRVTMFDIMREVERQCEGFHYTDFCPITTGHTLCCFYSTYIKDGDSVKCLLSDRAKEGGVSCCEQSPLEIIRKDRDFVLNKWEVAGGESPACSCGETNPAAPMDFDQFLDYQRRNTFTVTGMAFQDAGNLDAERLKRCRVQVLSADNRLIPFCAYNSIYREQGVEVISQ